jgi:hypothetical protein
LYRRLGGPQGQAGKARKISPPPGFDPRTVQPVAQSLYRLSYPAHTWGKYLKKISSLSLTKSIDVVVYKIKKKQEDLLEYFIYEVLMA